MKAVIFIWADVEFVFKSSRNAVTFYLKLQQNTSLIPLSGPEEVQGVGRYWATETVLYSFSGEMREIRASGGHDKDCL